MLVALPKTIWLRLNAIFRKQEKEAATTYVEIQSVQQQTIKPHEAYNPFRRNMY